MAAVGLEEDPAVQAARILLTLRNRRLRRWPEWVQKEPEMGEGGVCWTLEGWPKRQRNGNRLRGAWRAANLAVSTSAPAPTGSGACSSAAEERERSPAAPRWRERSTQARPGHDELMARPPDSPAYYCAPTTGSGPSTSASADRKARPRHAVETTTAAKAPSPASVAAAPKVPPMKAPSPETPLDFGAAAAGSGASSSGDDNGARPPSKRKAPGALGSVGGGACSGDEGCSSPDKRAQADAAGDDGEKKAVSEPKTQTPDTEKSVKFEFDLNMPWAEDADSPGFC